MNLIISIFIFVFLVVPCIAQKNKLRGIGTVIAEERLFGHIYSDKAINTSYLVVRLDKVIEGREQSRYLLVRRNWKLKDYPTPFDSENETQWELTLSIDNKCRTSLREIQFVFFGENGKTNGLLPRLKRKRGAETESLPFSETLPCYRLDDNNSKLDRSFIPRQQTLDPAGNNLFVLETELFTNEANNPLRISWFGNGTLMFTNVSSQSISEYQLGCIIKKENNIEVLTRMPKTKADMEPNISLLTPKGSDGTNDHMDELFTCYQSKSKLTAVEVTNKDGSIWKLK